MKMKEVCKRTGLTERTVRFYVEQELIQPKTELVNGREYRTYTEQDIAELLVIADLRKAFFSVEEIKTMKREPERIRDIVAAYKEKQAADAAAKSALVSALDEAGASDLASMSALAAKLGKVASGLPLPRRDVEPNFGRFDGTSKMERELEYEQFLHRQERQVRLGHGLVLGICGLMLLQSLAGLFMDFHFGRIINLILTIIFSIALYSGVVWVRYLLAGLASLALIGYISLLFPYATEMPGWLLGFILANMVVDGVSAVLLIKNQAMSEFLYEQKYG